METFSSIYILNLHGNSKKKERSPDGSKDENVFDIQQGVTISIFVKQARNNEVAKIYHSELWGTRKDKYSDLLELDISKTSWKELKVNSVNNFFIPINEYGALEYTKFYGLADIFLKYGNGIGTDRDSLFYDLNESNLKNRITCFFSKEGLEPPFSSNYRVENSSSYKLLERRKAAKFDPVNIASCLYRPFDLRWLYYDPKLTSRPAYEIMQHMQQKNLSLLATRQVASSSFQHVYVTGELVDRDPVSLVTRERTQVFPVYLYPSKEPTKTLLDDVLQTGRRPNLTLKFIEDFSAKLKMTFIPDGKGDRKKTFGPEDVFSYMYAVFHSPQYRKRYAEFLKTDFPRLPLTSKPELFRKLCAHGDELVALHLMEKHGPKLTGYPVAGDSTVEKVRYEEPHGEVKGRVWINGTQYFEGVPKNVWEFHVGGYQVCEKWLKDRKGRQLSYDDLTHYQHVVSALAETIRLMAEIDKVINEGGGWPIQ